MVVLAALHGMSCDVCTYLVQELADTNTHTRGNCVLCDQEVFDTQPRRRMAFDEKRYAHQDCLDQQQRAERKAQVATPCELYGSAFASSLLKATGAVNRDTIQFTKGASARSNDLAEKARRCSPQNRAPHACNAQAGMNDCMCLAVLISLSAYKQPQTVSHQSSP